MIYYYSGIAWNKLGQKKKAKESFEKSTQARNTSRWADLIYYQAKSYEELGNSQMATRLLEQLIARGNRMQEKGASTAGIGVEQASLKDKSLSEAFYLQGLGHKGSGHEDKANDLFRKALNTYQNNLWAKFHLTDK
jgi:tetratricopeptide (TPR) repeat protein